MEYGDQHIDQEERIVTDMPSERERGDEEEPVAEKLVPCLDGEVQLVLLRNQAYYVK